MSGIYKANPNIIKDPELIEEIIEKCVNYLMLVLVFSMMKPLQPLYKDRIPVVIKNTNRPQDIRVHL